MLKSWLCFSVPRLLLAFNQQDNISGLFLYPAWCFAASYTGCHLLPCFSWSFHKCFLYCSPSGYIVWWSVVQELNILFKHPETEIIKKSESLGFFCGSKSCGVGAITWTPDPASVQLQCLWGSGRYFEQGIWWWHSRAWHTFLTVNRLSVNLP